MTCGTVKKCVFSRVESVTRPQHPSRCPTCKYQTCLIGSDRLRRLYRPSSAARDRIGKLVTAAKYSSLAVCPDQQTPSRTEMSRLVHLIHNPLLFVSGTAAVQQIMNLQSYDGIISVLICCFFFPLRRQMQIPRCARGCARPTTMRM